jgi:AbrB family looped-hinge helix DNA binding protein
MVAEITQVGKRGTITIPKAVRDRIGLVEGSLLTIELSELGLLLRPAISTPVSPERYSAMRKAEFLLNNATDPADYQRAREQALALGVNPDDVPHDSPIK